MLQIAPLRNVLVVHDVSRLREKAYEAVGNAQFLGGGPSVRRAATAPQIQGDTRGVKRTHTLEHGRNGEALTPNAAHESIVHVEVHDSLTHGTPARLLTGKLRGRT